jgi:hypothetical protein
VVASFDDGPALWDVIVERGMEGVVAKREREPYRPGARTWVKVKNRPLPGSRRSSKGRGGELSGEVLDPGPALDPEPLREIVRAILASFPRRVLHRHARPACQRGGLGLSSVARGK